jgi:hypothetical protein
MQLISLCPASLCSESSRFCSAVKGVTPKLHEPGITGLKSHNCLENLARPKRFELLTLRFVAAPD